MHSRPLRPGAGGQGRAQAPTAGRGVRVHAAGYSAGGHRSARPSRRRAGSPPRPTNTKTGTGTGTGTGRVTGFRGGRSHPMRLRPTAEKRQPCPADRRGNARLGAVPCLRSRRPTMAWWPGTASPGPSTRTRGGPGPATPDAAHHSASGNPPPRHSRRPVLGPSAPREQRNGFPRAVAPRPDPRTGRRVLRRPGAVPSHRTSQGRATGPPFGPAPAEPQRDGQRSAPSGTQRHRGRVPRSCPVTGHPAGMEARSRQAVPRADRPAERAGGPTRLPAAGQCSRGAGTTWSAPPGAPGPPV